ncbi:hypothetical protein [Spongiactinospora sp. TRM90649]|uniref:hypothetical protein n=1 Tax=Spongiactinospora sp. TRM90649 TaxID=3031114 RepID=UPI0023F81740|nr:hypothetical protein [Spongiactinospora sp. TRM90649]MDF5756608.1 hypothetical protein [Spongiactinospora sp. TRM90649]
MGRRPTDLTDYLIARTGSTDFDAIARRLGVTRRTVERYEALRRRQEGLPSYAERVARRRAAIEARLLRQLALARQPWGLWKIVRADAGAYNCYGTYRRALERLEARGLVRRVHERLNGGTTVTRWTLTDPPVNSERTP